jgi:hypothetical protein
VSDQPTVLCTSTSWIQESKFYQGCYYWLLAADNVTGGKGILLEQHWTLHRVKEEMESLLLQRGGAWVAGRLPWGCHDVTLYQGLIG